jgi:hypothetical protein
MKLDHLRLLSLKGRRALLRDFMLLSTVLGSLSWCQTQDLHAQDLHAQGLPSPQHTNKAVHGGCDTKAIECANAASPFIQADGTVLLVWTAKGSVMVAKSKDGGQSFAEGMEIAHHDKFLDTGADARAQITGDAFGRVMVAYAFFKDSQWNAQINISTSLDHGEHFSPPKPLIPKGVSERFPSLGLDQRQRLFVTWVDKRLVHQERLKGRKKLGGSVALAYTDDWGLSFKGEHVVHTDSCECCRIALDVSMPQTKLLAYRALFSGGLRDHAVQVLSDQGQASAPRKVADDHWQTDVCPHQGPTVALSENTTIHTAWFTQGQQRQGLFYARSSDLGAHFSTPMAMGDLNTPESRPYVVSLGQEVWMVWKRFDGQRSSVMMRHSSDDGQSWSHEVSLSQTAGYSDHPLLIKTSKRVYLSWLTRIEGFQLKALN